jgi:hypothetical protein
VFHESHLSSLAKPIISKSVNVIPGLQQAAGEFRQFRSLAFFQIDVRAERLALEVIAAHFF